MAKKLTFEPLKQRYARIKGRCAQLHERQRQPISLAPLDTSEHECPNCGHHYSGRYCPQCSLPSNWKKFDWKELFSNLLEIFGIIKRPLFRTIGHLLWRPGYMIRDYLAGYHLRYFPPFKLLAIVTLTLSLLTWALGATMESHGILHMINYALDKTDSIEISQEIKQFLLNIEEKQKFSIVWIIIQNILVVILTWLFFHRKSKLNFIEIFYAQIYIICQFSIIAIVLLLSFLKIESEEVTPFLAPEWIAIPILIYDYKQLFQLSWWGTIWRTIALYLVMMISYVFIMITSVVLLVLNNDFLQNIF
ncbi:MAG: DUF3667 domain-containing protein [Bacteroidales bacterium]|nr:DUF3667 domain-containing protein [Bacteroidales bacterium]